MILNPILTSYQLKSIKELIKKFDFLIELTESKFNTDNKVINILTNKNIYILILIIFTIIPLIIILFRNKLKFLIFKFFIENNNISKAYKECKESKSHDSKIHK